MDTKNRVLEKMKEKIEALWSAIQKARSAEEQARLRALYRDAMSVYQRQKLILEAA